MTYKYEYLQINVNRTYSCVHQAQIQKLFKGEGEGVENLLA